MKALDSVLSDVMNLRTKLSKRRANSLSERHRAALDALIQEVDKLPSFATDLFLRGDEANSVSSGARFPFANLKPGEHFDVDHERVNSLRACASGWAARNGVRLTVRSKPNGGARCIRLDGVEGVPPGLASLRDEEDLTAHDTPPQASVQHRDLVARGLAPSCGDEAGSF